jgi:hypothetical protein
MQPARLFSLGGSKMAKFYCMDVHGVIHFGATPAAARAKALMANRTYP